MISILLLSMSLIIFPAQDRDDVSKRLEHATEVLDELLNSPDADIPQEILDDAECVAVIYPTRTPGFGFEFGFESARGASSCRTDAGWSSPLMLSVDGGAFGFQVGEFSAMVLLFMVDDSIDYLIGKDQPWGHSDRGPKSSDPGGATPTSFDAEILTYDLDQDGYFFRIEVPLGGPLRWEPDREANEVLYGREISAEEILLQGIPVPDLATEFVAALRSN